MSELHPRRIVEFVQEAVRPWFNGSSVKDLGRIAAGR